jgi:hypothetical protein
VLLCQLERGSLKKSWSRRLREKSAQTGADRPIGTIAFYGSDRSYASKVVVGIAAEPGASVDILERWFDRGVDVRLDPRIGAAVGDFLRRHKVREIAVSDGIIGCPHEEVVDYPEGEECPHCPWWHGRDRWTGELLEP